jgi:PTH1 family peptidyl-tRNA hydrolase
VNVGLVIGLGNPGERYAHTRHNIGFDVAAEVVRRGGPREWLVRPDCELAVVTPGRMVVVARPLLYMNRSGGVVRALLDGCELEPDNLLVVVDDIDLPLGALRLRARGGPGTHNGLRDIHERIGSGFPRLRVGIRGSVVPGDLADYVLSPFDHGELPLVESVVDRAADAVESVLRVGVERSMNIYNQAGSRPG